jgi:hypothetical protein
MTENKISDFAISTTSSALATLYDGIMEHDRIQSVISELYDLLNPQGNPMQDVEVYLNSKFMAETTVSGLVAKVQQLLSSPTVQTGPSARRAGKNFVMSVIIIHFKLDLRDWIPVFKEVLASRVPSKREGSPPMMDLSLLEELPFSDGTKMNICGMFSNVKRALTNINFVMTIAARVRGGSEYHATDAKDVKPPRLPTSRKRAREEEEFVTSVRAKSSSSGSLPQVPQVFHQSLQHSLQQPQDQPMGD